MRKILLNLIFNAIKYMPPSGHVGGGIKQATKDSYVHVILDDGIGMSSECISQMCNPFSREKNSLTDTVEGNGLGLSIVKDSLDLYKGVVECKSALICEDNEINMAVVTHMVKKGWDGN